MPSQIGGTYSFTDVTLVINGPGGSVSAGAAATPVNIGTDAGVSEEGVTIEMLEDKNTMQIGADGFGQHSLHAGNASRWRVRLLKTSPTNALLSTMYAYQRQSSAYWGQNSLSLRNAISGDEIVGMGGAFNRIPSVNFAKEGGTMEWTFDVIVTDHNLGDYQPIIVTN